MILFHCCHKYNKVVVLGFVRKGGALNGMSDMERSVKKFKLSLIKMFEMYLKMYLKADEVYDW